MRPGVSTGLRTWLGLARSLAIYRARPWRQRQLAAFYAGILRPGDLAFDIGAHVGNRTRAMLAAGARVVALEPQAAFHAFLARDLPPGATLLRLAAGPAQGEAELAVSRLHPTVSSLAADFPARMRADPGFSAVRWDSRERVEVTTLDALIAAHGLPRLIKIDVEGFEAEVVAGLSQPVPWVAFEYLPAALAPAEAAIARLAALGRYRFNLVTGEATGFSLPGWLDATAIRPGLDAAARSGRSGDVYARLDGGTDA
jgi:FkbM family methyltransferase